TNLTDRLEVLSRAYFDIGAGAGVELSQPAQTRDGDRFVKCDVPGDGGFEVVDLFFIFGSDAYGAKPGWDYSLGAEHRLVLKTARGQNVEYIVEVGVAKGAVGPAMVRWRLAEAGDHREP